MDTLHIDPERLAREFTRLCEIESPSRCEGRLCRALQDTFRELGADEVIEDGSAAQTGSECGNLLARFAGDLPLAPLFLACHMDTVGPTAGIRVLRQGERFTSAGDTVLGGDDKSGIAACIEALRALKASRIPHRPVEILCTTCEEIGLLGAKSLDPALLRAREGYALDGAGFGELITKAPALRQLKAVVTGVAAHAGLHPEWGVNAITLAARALADMPCGRIDQESSINFGLIQGGTASNIVPDRVEIEGEIRSHNPQKLNQLAEAITARFVNTARHWTDPGGAARGKPRIEVQADEGYPAMALEDSSPVVRRIDQAARIAGLPLVHKAAGGCSDANLFNGKGLATVIVATGMTNVHTVNEQIALADMAGLTRMILALLAQTGD